MGAITRGFANNILSSGTVDATDGLTGTIPASNITNTSVSAVTSMPASVGDFIEVTATDPTPVGTEGQVWYNSTSGTFKTALGGYAVWSAGGNVGSSFYQAATGGTQTAAYKAGGGFPRASTASESYNGTSWTTAGSLNTARSRLSQGVVGTQTAGLGTGGYNTSLLASVEAFNGSSWTSVTSMPAGRQGAGASGLQTASLVFGGSPSPTSSISYNGSSWTAAPNMITGGSLTGVGTQTATLAVSTITESYNGTAWTAGTTLTTPRSQISGGGTQTSSIFSGGTTPAPTTVATTEEWNGTSWSTKSNLATARRLAGNHGTASNNVMTSSGINAPGSQVTSTEIYNVYGVTVPVAGSWSSGGSLPTATRMAGGCGTQTAALFFGGATTPGNVATTLKYDGTAWTSTGSLNTARQSPGGAGTQTAALAFGGSSNLATESFNGTSWTSLPGNMNTSVTQRTGFGIQTAAIAAGGQLGSSPFAAQNNAESWNGSVWTNVNTINTTRHALASAGIQTAGLIFLGGTFPATGATESWNGTSWTSVNSANTARKATPGGAGTQTAALAFGGALEPGASSSATESWNGTSWTSNPTGLATARSSISSAGTQASALASGGYNDPSSQNQTATEEWTGPYSTLNYKTLTTS